MGSLTHFVTFHASIPSEISTTMSTGEPRWFVQEAWTSGARQGRGTHHSRMFRIDDGFHIATTMQDGMVRLAVQGKEGKVGFSPEAMTRGVEEKIAKRKRKGREML